MKRTLGFASVSKSLIFVSNDHDLMCQVFRSDLMLPGICRELNIKNMILHGDIFLRNVINKARFRMSVVISDSYQSWFIALDRATAGQ